MRIEEFNGSGFIPGIPASKATAPCRIKFDDNGGILEVVAPGQLFSDEIPPAETSTSEGDMSRGEEGE